MAKMLVAARVCGSGCRFRSQSGVDGSAWPPWRLGKRGSRCKFSLTGFPHPPSRTRLIVFDWDAPGSGFCLAFFVQVGAGMIHAQDAQCSGFLQQIRDTCSELDLVLWSDGAWEKRQHSLVLGKVGQKAARFLVSHQGRSGWVWAVWYPIGGVDYVAIDLYHHGSGILLDSICTKQ